MCGIFGFVTTADSEIDTKNFQSVINSLFLLSESRGKDASGLMFLTNDEVTILKRPIRARQMIKSSEYKKIFSSFSNISNKQPTPIVFMGHARMVTNGSEEVHDNNQPVVYPNSVVLHNGIIVNDSELWQSHPELERRYQVDTEIILALHKNFRILGNENEDAFRMTFSLLKGANSIALVPLDSRTLFLASSNGSLYYSLSQNGNMLLFASELDFLAQMQKHSMISLFFGSSEIKHIDAGESYSFDIETLVKKQIYIDSTPSGINKNNLPEYEIRNIVDYRPIEGTINRVLKSVNVNFLSQNEKYFSSVRGSISALKRCKKCILPETFPNIDFDDQGVCNYCRNYKPVLINPLDELKLRVSNYKKGVPNCLVPVSGGRDSCYSLHVIKKELGLNPIAYTYDWGMVTDLARRNISRMCGALGIEHILVSADIKSKRSNIQKNVLAWLKKPVLGTIPLFMAGDKQYFYYAYKIKKSYELQDIFMGENHYEKTLFKTGFTGARQTNSGYMAYHISGLNKARMAAYYARQFLTNPAYINKSLVDTFSAFVSFYFIPHDYINLFNYIQWDENIVAKTIIEEYEWECSKDTKTTWRIGDGTSPFYNYIYLNMAGFTENDTFRSNQIRDGVITRDEALNLTNRDNEPLYDSIKWYCDTIQVDMDYALTQINRAKKLYQLK